MMMSITMQRVRSAACIAAVLLVIPARAYAYVDPGLGGQLFQAVYLIVIGVTGLLVAPLLLFARTIARAMRRAFRRRGPPSAPPA